MSFFKKSGDYEEQGITTLIGRGAQFKGNIDTQGTVRIEGTLEGQINAQGDIYIAEDSLVKADLFGKKVIVAGQVQGTIEALHGLEITSTGQVHGDITGAKLIVAEGALYRGKVNMDLITSKTVDEGLRAQAVKNKSFDQALDPA
jgi:cytoskeletal protein CcmA (bactofilin family)